jgi:hypothetical protein
VLADGIAKNIHQKIGKTIDHFRLVAKPIGRVHHAQDFNNSLNTIEATERRTSGGEQIQSGLAGRLDAFLNRKVLPDFALVRPLRIRRVAGDEQQVADLHSAYVVCDRRIRRWQYDVLFF